MRLLRRRLSLLLAGLLGSCLAADSFAQAPITFQYFYDDTGQLVKVVDSTGVAIDYVYDAVGNMLEVRRSSIGTPGGLSIFSFTPQQGGPLATVTIQGQGFSVTPSANTVLFNGTPAAVVSASSTTLVVAVPVGATSGPISVSVSGATVASSINFTAVQSPAITSLQPNAALGGKAIALRITGINLTGSTFSFVPAFSPPAIVVGSASIDPSGTSATLNVALSATAVGTFALVATNAAGSSSSFPSAENRFLVIDPNSNADSDGDGFPDALEAQLGSDPFDPASKPDIHPPELTFRFSLLNRALPFLTQPTPQEPTFTFSLLNRTLPFSTQPTPQEPTFAFSLLNRALPFSTQSTPQEPTFTFSLLNRASPASGQLFAFDLGFLFSVNNAPGAQPIRSITGQPVQLTGSGTLPPPWKDSDGDGLPDVIELRLSGSVSGAKPDNDSDHDGLSNIMEVTIGTDPNRADTDGDGLSDGDEVDVYHTDPLNPDSDGDRFSDSDEIRAGTNPLDSKSVPDFPTKPVTIEIVSPGFKVDNKAAGVGQSNK